MDVARSSCFWMLSVPHGEMARSQGSVGLHDARLCLMAPQAGHWYAPALQCQEFELGGWVPHRSVVGSWRLLSVARVVAEMAGKLTRC